MYLEHLGIRWGYVFLHTASHLPGEDLRGLMREAVEMYLHGEEERVVRHEGFEGKLYTEHRHELLGGFGGQRFDAELDTDQGRDSATFLVNEQTGSGSGFSRN